ncbi:MAG: transcriptional regulator [Leifsonia xyli]|nr:MAG: transcriptional regulator [Leifsonia xyli]
MNGCQIRAARALLNWSQQDLADKAALDRSVIKLAEKEVGRSQKASLFAIERVFEAQGVSFTASERVVGVTIDRDRL